MKRNTRVVPSFWWSEFIRSEAAVRHGLDNTPPVGGDVERNILHVLAPGMQRVRECLGAPVLITSGYRSLAVNARVGGSKQSQHMLGLAADFVAPSFGLPLTVARHLQVRWPEIRFDALIWERDWVHASFVPPGEERRQVLTAHFEAGGVRYTQGLG